MIPSYRKLTSDARSSSLLPISQAHRKSINSTFPNLVQLKISTEDQLRRWDAFYVLSLKPVKIIYWHQFIGETDYLKKPKRDGLKATNEWQDDGTSVLHQVAQHPIDQVCLYTRHPYPSRPDLEGQGTGVHVYLTLDLLKMIYVVNSPLTLSWEFASYSGHNFKVSDKWKQWVFKPQVRKNG